MTGDSLFGKLAHTACLRESVGDQQHRDLFRRWLGLGLQEQYTDLEAFLTGLGDADRAEAWIESVQPGDLVPTHALDVERDLFVGDLEILFEAWRSRFANRQGQI